MDQALSLDQLLKANPWRALVDSNSYVLPDDLAPITNFNNKCSKEAFRICLKLFPEPFVGSLHAPIWFLNLNPGLDQSDLSHNEGTQAAQKTNLCLEATEFWYLDSAFSRTSGHVWWTKRLRRLIEAVGSISLVSKNIFCLEFFPYHSIKYKALPALLPSQSFTCQLVQAALREGKHLILMRSVEQWKECVSGLKAYPYLRLKNPRCGYVSPGNFDAFDDLCARVRMGAV